MMLNFDFTFEDLYDTEGLNRLDAQFLSWLESIPLVGEATFLQSATSQSPRSQNTSSQFSTSQSSPSPSPSPSTTSQSSRSQNTAPQFSTSQSSPSPSPSSASQSATSQSSTSQNASSPKHSLVAEILEARKIPHGNHSDLILKLAPYLEDFLGELFQIRSEITQLRTASDALAPLSTAKRLFIQRIAAKAYPKEEARALDGLVLKSQLESLMGEPYSDLAFALHILKWMDEGATNANPILVIPAGLRNHGDASKNVIPAKVGNQRADIKMDPCLRRDDTECVRDDTECVRTKDMDPATKSRYDDEENRDDTGCVRTKDMDTAIESRHDDEENRDDTGCVKNSTECVRTKDIDTAIKSRYDATTTTVIPTKVGNHSDDSSDVIPAKAGIQSINSMLDPCLRRDDTECDGDNTDCVTLAQALDLAKRYAAWALHQDSPSPFFTLPKKIDLTNLVDREHTTPVHREGFDLTDPGVSNEQAYLEAHYCIGCHAQKKDSCSKGFKEGEGFQKNSLGIPLSGCPLDEKISEMNVLRQQGVVVGALATAIIDNPMVAGTGHRICNDCMKSCIFQKQDPVNIPAIETQTLDQVLALPWGFEIYSLLTRWNPLNFERPYPKPPSGRTVLVAGMGPSGYTLAHHLMNEGHNVVGIDGLKIEPLPPEAYQPIQDISHLYERLSERTLWGFGGVAEYGITARWNKNYLKIIRLLLERRPQFALHGSVRLGSTLTLDECTALGFDHVALCLGAGKPHMPDIKGGLPKGVRMASDFLMGLQLTGAYKRDSIANLQIRLPIVVVGGGLTALDTATEAMAYYPVQVEKFLKRCEEVGESRVLGVMTPEEREISEIFLIHARYLRDEKALALSENRPPRVGELLDQWGGCKVVYRRTLTESPAYRLNHEEVHLAFQQGVQFVENFAPLEIKTDAYGACRSLLSSGGQEVPCNTLLIAAGTAPNTVIASEEGLPLEGKYFRLGTNFGIEGRDNVTFFGDLHPQYAGNVVKAMASAKNGYPEISRALERKSPLGTWPTIKAEMARRLTTTVREVRRLTPTIVEVILHSPQAAEKFRPGQFFRFQNFERSCDVMPAGLRIHGDDSSDVMPAGLRIHGDDSSDVMPAGLRIHGDDSSDVIPAKAGNQSINRRLDPCLRRDDAGCVRTKDMDTAIESRYDAEEKRDDTECVRSKAMEPLAMTGAWVDVEKGLISLIVLEMGGSSNLCADLKVGEHVSLMGPTGTPTTIAPGETVLLVGGGLGNAVLFSIGKAFREAGSKVLYFAGYKTLKDRFKTEDIEAAADQVVWCCDETPGFEITRPQDHSFQGTILEALEDYAQNPNGIRIQDVDRLITIGSDGMMAAIAKACKTSLAPYLRRSVHMIASINSPMQCMMKEICGQCLQEHKNPQTGEIRLVFSCANQDQSLDEVNFNNLQARLSQNGAPEKLTRLWLDKTQGEV